ncbi:retrovirus-related pol polyprotein from transposon TNT 1-94 [Tanacetum coccineum]
MLAPGNYVQWKSRIKRYIDTKPNSELIHYCLQNPPYTYQWAEKTVPVAEGSSETTTERYMENYKNVSQDIRDQLNAEAEAVQIILTGIDNDIYSTVDACPNACEMWKAIERLKQGESINVQDLETNLYWEFGKFTSRDEWQRFVTLVKQSQELKTVSYHKLYDILKQHQNEVNEIRAERLARTTNPLALVAQQQPVYHHQNHPTQNTQYSSTRSQQSTRNRGKAIVTSSAPTYDPEPATVTEDEEMSKEKEIDKLMALISLSFKKIYKPTNNNLRTSSNTRKVGTLGKRMLLCKQEEAGVQLNAEQADWKDDTDDESEDQELEAHYMYMAQIQEVTPDPVDNSRPIFDDEPMHKVQNNNDNYNVFAMENEHPEQPESSNDIYLAEHGDTNITIDSLDICNDRAQDDQDDNDLAKERELLASLIKKLKCEIDDSKNHNKFLESSNKALVDKLKAPESDEMIRLDKESQSKLSDLIRPFDYDKLNNLYDLERRKQEVEDHRRNFKFSNNKTSVTACNDSLNAKTSNVNFVCVTCGKCVLNDNHDLCVLHYINGVSSRTRQPIAVPISTREPKHNVNQSVATSSKKTVATDSTVKKSRHITRKLYEQVSKTCSWWYPKYTPPGYNWKPKSQIGNVNPNVSMPLGNASRTANILEHKTPRCSTVSNTPLSSNSFAARTVKFGNDQIAPILGYGDLGNDLLTGSRGTDLYSITLQDSTTPNPICLMAKATSSQAWLWHRRLSHLNFDTINLLSKNNIVNGLPKLKFVKDHLSKDETPGVLIGFLTLVQRGLHAQVTTVRSDKGTEFLNKTLHAYFAIEGIRYEMSTSRTPEQNGVVERRNRTLVEAARTMLRAAKVPLFFWAEAIAIACFTQNRSLVIPRHEKTPYHIINARKPSVKFFHIFGSLCYIIRDGENLDKMKEKDDTCIFVGYSTQSKAYRVFNKRTKIIVETIHVNFDELPQMVSDHVSSDPGPQCSTMVLEQESLLHQDISVKWN